MPSDTADRVSRPVATGVIQVDGMTPSRLLAPASAIELAGILAEAEAIGAGVIPVGGATQLALGNLPERCDWMVQTANLNRILEYEPKDLTVSVEAGVTLQRLNDALVVHGQIIPLDTADPARATLGGLVASGLSGPRRLGLGSLRDLLIGIGAAHPSGQVSKAGGMVVKNVSGYDLMRLYHGSLGTLAVITSVNLKVLSRPQADVTVTAAAASMQEALETALRWRNGTARPVAVEIWREQDRWFCACRVQGRKAAIGYLIDSAVKDCTVATEVKPDAASEQFWTTRQQCMKPETAEGEIVVMLSTRPREIGRLLQDVVALESDPGAPSPFSIECSPGLGQVRLRFSAPADVADAQALIFSLRRIAPTAFVLAAPPGVKKGLDVWGDQPDTLPVMQALKQEFDPRRVLNPGRFIGRI